MNAVAIPDFVPKHIRPLMAGRRFTLAEIPEAVRRRMKTPERISVSDYADRYRRIPPGDGYEGPWRRRYAPHTVRVMDCFGKPWVREVWFCGSEQSGKTQTLLNCLHWAIDIAPGPVFYLMPTESMAQKVMMDKLIPMFRGSLRLKKLLSRRADDVSLYRVAFRHGVIIRTAWANSAASMATFPARYAFGDEVDKYPDTVGRETGPIELISRRTRIYKGRFKKFFASTPAQGVIYKGMMACKQVWEMRQRCPHCGGLFRPEGDGLIIPEGLSADAIDSRSPISYACTLCGGLIDEAARQKLLQEPCWVCIKGEDDPRPETVGWHHRAWDCLEVPLHEIARAWLRAKKGGVAEKIAWINSYEAENYEIETAEMAEDYILRLRDETMPRGVVPDDTACLIVTADTQQLGFHYAVWAFGWGEELPMALIEHGYLETFAQLAQMAARPRKDRQGRDCFCDSGWIDSGGGTNPLKPQHSRTEEVYRFCKANPFWRPLKGARKIDGARGWTQKNMEFYPRRRGGRDRLEPIPGGLLRWNIDVTLYKNDAAGKLKIEPDDPGAIRLHADVTSDYAKQLCAEYRDERGWWQCPSGRDNHQWDCLVYALFAAAYRHVREWPRPAAEPEGRTETAPPGRGARVYSRGVEL